MYQTSQELRALQLKCLEILQVVDKICRDNQIEYSLCGGSVVGAHLYGGFVPWDDDIDLMMTRKNYEAFRKACKKQLPSKYELWNYKTKWNYKGIKQYRQLFSKVVDTTTTLVEQNGAVSGVFLDITVYDKVPLQPMRQKIDFWISKYSLLMIYYDFSNSDSLLKKLGSLIGNHCSLLYLCAEGVIRLLSHTKKYGYCELFSGYCPTKLYRNDIYESYADIAFEGGSYRIVKNYVDYLVTRYDRTDFYEPEDKQVPSHYQYVNFDLPYRDYLKSME